ncbi:adhesion G-protein coupled receptor F1-like [Rana temporaria]|uniref:adhesion G-protein coupled receptor F1-like n=1 Tax=Rana temporaria TaxID=8407 RepID=UPI001AAD3CE3|nr:adhesion G-protein coupled receptor F1-like [Rana temporaria]
MFSTMETTFTSFRIVSRGIDISCTVFNPDGLNEGSYVELLSGATVFLSPEIFKKINKSSGAVINVLSMIYAPTNGSFNLPYDSSDGLSYSLASSIWTIVAIVNKKSEHSLNIHMNFTCNNITSDETAVCVFWNLNTNKWSSEGCNTTVINGSAYCACNHLTSFSVLMAGYIPEEDQNLVLLDTLTKILLPVSIGSLLNCIAIEIFLLKQSKSSVALYRHICIIHIAVFLLISNVSFLATSLFDMPSHRFLCKILTFVTHFSLLAFFSWTLVQGLFLVCQLLFVFHHFTKKEFLLLSSILGYGIPSAIAGGTFLVFYPHKYLMSNACWLDNISGAFLLFAIPAIVIMGGNILVLVVVIAKIFKSSVSQGKSEDDEVVEKLMKAVLFCTPQFGLTWALGIPLYVYPKTIFLHYIFALLNPLQGFFLLLFGCLLDKKFYFTCNSVLTWECLSHKT